MMSDLPGSAVSCSRLAVIQEGGESAVWLVWGWAPCPGWAWSRELDSWPVTIAGSSIVQSLPRPLGRPEPQSAIKSCYYYRAITIEPSLAILFSTQLLKHYL